MMPTIPAAVRILPMDSKKEEFLGWSVEKLQTRFFLGEMPSPPHPGRYQFRERGLDAAEGTVALFQFASQIIASAVFVKSEQYRSPNGPYRGALWFDPTSIRVFEPVGADVVREIWPDFAGFSNVRKSLGPGGYSAFERRLTGIEVPPRTIEPGSAADLNDYAIENRKIEIEQRQKQSLFRTRVLENFEGRCCLSGISEEELLVASHIVPWAKRIDTRLDPANGLLLYSPYDRLFDKGFISFDVSFRVLVAPWVGRCSLPLRAVLEQLAGQQARRPVKWAIKPEYLEYHRTEVLQAHRRE